MNRTESSAYAALPTCGTAQVATRDTYHLAEGPVWDPIRERLLWVDIEAGAVYDGRLAGDGRIGSVSRLVTVADTAGTVAISATGSMVVAGSTRLHYFNTEGVRVPGGELMHGEGRRFNDGKPDPAGRFVVGTKGPGNESLVRIDAEERVTTFDDDLSLSNGIAWTADGLLLYSVDTLAQKIYVRSYEPNGEVGERRLFFTFEDGYPDGATVDAEGCLWVAVWGLGTVIRISPDGIPVARVDVPVPHVSSVAFAGPDLDTLVITTAREGLTKSQLDRFPLSGSLFTTDTGITASPPRCGTANDHILRKDQNEDHAYRPSGVGTTRRPRER
ncbi:MULTISPECIES: SMP-30/gluconolactonase/LRE family protein [unclassified Microbacterium]|uniref:SMP-30/gluconolactonase/LRE family protein n=1 Tax=unclassified Microbacterium TaxID=2609290 RepID=UPI000EA882A5|nr:MULTISPECIES: SMP-30/gluconolactonase/LRE family protein [unclassified Microbacterium]MBT2486501.1 SMP-30/gluconolactonase/LRE family protein [Microbacterium sp. ISL-108]RKN69197.1 SMP-30/gluconolactonase/LRE family protein [Microbacterium sp. CGR2]